MVECSGKLIQIHVSLKSDLQGVSLLFLACPYSFQAILKTYDFAPQGCYYGSLLYVFSGEYSDAIFARVLWDKSGPALIR